MKRLILILIATNLSISLAQAKPMRVIVDPGHGGTDSGATQQGLKESHIALDVGKKLKELLEKDSEFQVRLTREHDQQLSLQQRVQFAEKEHADLFVSLHANAAPDKRARGAEIYFQSNLSSNEEAFFLAAHENQIEESMKEDPSQNDGEGMSKSSDVQAIVEDLQRQNRVLKSFSLSKKIKQEWNADSVKSENSSIKQGPFYVLSKAKMPSILVELGYLTHPKEAQKIAKADYQWDMAQKIYQGLRRYKDLLDNQKP